MKKRAAVVVGVLVVIVLGISVWLYAYANQKSNDNLPSLSAIAEMKEADVNKLLIGYRRTQLRTVWEEPTSTDTNLDIWEISGTTTLGVSYNNKDKVTACRLSTGN